MKIKKLEKRIKEQEREIKALKKELKANADKKKKKKDKEKKDKKDKAKDGKKEPKDKKRKKQSSAKKLRKMLRELPKRIPDDTDLDILAAARALDNGSLIPVGNVQPSAQPSLVLPLTQVAQAMPAPQPAPFAQVVPAPQAAPPEETTVNTAYSGLLTVQVPRTLYGRLVDAAQNEGVSLQQVVLYKLSK